MKFDPNEHDRRPLLVKVKRLGKTLIVKGVFIGATLDGEMPFVWGFANDGDKKVEFDTSWGDIVGLDL